MIGIWIGGIFFPKTKSSHNHTKLEQPDLVLRQESGAIRFTQNGDHTRKLEPADHRVKQVNFQKKWSNMVKGQKFGFSSIFPNVMVTSVTTGFFREF